MATNLKALQDGNKPSQDVAQKPRTIFDFLNGDPKVEKAINAVASKFMTADRFLRLAVNAVKKTPLLMQCDPQTVLGSFMASAALGLEPNTVQQQAFLIPYKKKVKQPGGQWVDTYECQFQVGYRGFITLAHRSPHILTLQAEAIHEKDFFDHLVGTESFLKYRKAMKDRGDLIGAFAYSRLESGTEIATILPVDELYKIRSRSETYNALNRNILSADDAKGKIRAEQKLADTPWVMWEDDMSAKSAIKKHAKQLPLMPGEAMAAAVQLDTDGDDRTIDMASMVDPDTVRSVMQDGFAPEKEEPLSVEHQEGVFLKPQTIRPLDTVHQDDDEQQQPRAQHATASTTTGPTFAQVADRIHKAQDIDMLDADADLIKDVADESLHAELKEIYRTKRAELESPKKPAPRQRATMNVD